MNKVIVCMLVVIVVTMGIITAVSIVNLKTEKEIDLNIAKESNITENNIEEDINQNEIVEETNVSQEKISPNAFITYKTTFQKCGHTSNEFKEIPKELVNLTEEELQERYSEWEIEEFSDVNIVISKNVDENCNEHFVVRDNNGVVTVFRKSENGKENEYETTDIATEYLTETDKINMEKGIEVNGIQNLNQLIEDFE